eukprot:scaffold228_cov312-Pinguiococcus_pyrenoidosus.AAC.36
MMIWISGSHVVDGSAGAQLHHNPHVLLPDVAAVEADGILALTLVQDGDLALQVLQVHVHDGHDLGRALVERDPVDDLVHAAVRALSEQLLGFVVALRVHEVQQLPVESKGHAGTGLPE